jgi:hypothetical protein
MNKYFLFLQVLNPGKHSHYYMYHLHNIKQKLYILATECIYLLCKILSADHSGHAV